jgi:dienelactone hydrolase
VDLPTLRRTAAAALAAWTVSDFLSATRGLAETGRGRIETVGSYRVLLLSGSYYDMGRARGELLRSAVRRDVQTFLGRRPPTGAGVDNVPGQYLEELRGLADGAQLPFDDVLRAHTQASWPALGAGDQWAAFGTATVGGKLLHVLRLDGPETTAADSAWDPILAVYRPPDGSAYFCVQPTGGFIGSITGMSERGISATYLDPAARPASPVFHPAVWMRESLRLGDALLTATDAISRAGKPAVAVAAIIADGKAPDAVAVEIANGRIALFGPNDSVENQAPFFPLPYVVRRTNGLVSQPNVGAFGAIDRYQALSRQFSRPRPLSAADALRLSESGSKISRRPFTVVISPTDQMLWISNPTRDNDESQAADVIGVRVTDWFERPGAAAAVRGSIRLDDAAERLTRGRIEPRRRHDNNSIPEIYRLSDDPFEFELEPWMVSNGVARSKLRFPSPLLTEHPENNVVHGEWFRPFGRGPFPCVLMLHIAGGDFDLSRTISQMLSTQRIAVLFVKMPYYGERRPPHSRIRMVSNDLERGLRSMRQVVLDLRRACDWIEGRPDLDGRIGIMGISLGAITGSLACAIEPRITHACVVMGGGELQHILYESTEREAIEYRAQWSRAGGTRESFSRVMAPYDPASYPDRLRERVVLMICASNDRVIPRQSTLALWEAAGRQRIVWYPAGHYSMAAYLLPAMSQASRFFRLWPSRLENQSQHDAPQGAGAVAP